MHISFRATERCRCDQVLCAQLPNLSRSYIHNNISELTVNGIHTKLSHRVTVGDLVCATIVEQATVMPTPCHMPFDVVYEDEYLLVINKPDTISVHPGAHNEHDPAPTIVQGLHYRYPHLAQQHAEGTVNPSNLNRFGIIHRLDKKTSGLLMLAKRADAIEPLQMLFRKRTVKKWYLAIIKGCPQSLHGSFEDTLTRHPVHRQRFITSGDSSIGKFAKTDYHCLWSDKVLTVVILQPSTGRTHQLRVQLSARNTPVVGDDLYGRPQPALRERYTTLTARMYLHAIRLEFRHPFTGHILRLSTELPQSFRQLIATIRNQ